MPHQPVHLQPGQVLCLLYESVPQVSRAGYILVSSISPGCLALSTRSTFLFWDFVLYSGLEWRFFFDFV
jgi:hypothetical protein